MNETEPRGGRGIVARLKEQWFLLALTGVVVATVTFPARIAPVTNRLDVRTIVIAILFLMSATLETAALVKALRKPALVVLGVVLGYVLVPAFGWLWAQGLNRLRVDFGIGILIMCAMPCTLASATIWTRLAGGNEALSLLVTVVSNGVSFLVTPLILFATLGRAASPAPGDMIGKLFVVVFLPVLGGQLLRRWRTAAAAADRRKKLLSGVTQGLILTVICSGLVRAVEELEGSGRAVPLGHVALLLVAVAVIHLLAAAGCWATCRLLNVSRAERLALMFGGSQKTLPAALYVAYNFFGAFPLAAVPALVYHASQLVLDTYLAQGARRRA